MISSVTAKALVVVIRKARLTLALERLKETLRQCKSSPAEIAHYAEDAGVWKVVQPYLEAMTANA